MTPMQMRNLKTQAKYEATKELKSFEILVEHAHGLSMIDIKKKVGVSLKMVRDVLVEHGRHKPKEWK